MTQEPRDVFPYNNAEGFINLLSCSLGIDRDKIEKYFNINKQKGTNATRNN